MACATPANISSACGNRRPDVWIVGEKILEPGEQLRPEWPIDGTTGYDFLNRAGGLFVDSSQRGGIQPHLPASSRAKPPTTPRSATRRSTWCCANCLGSDVNRLTALLAEIFADTSVQRDYTRVDAGRGIRELVARAFRCIAPMLCPIAARSQPRTNALHQRSGRSWPRRTGRNWIPS